PIFHLYLSSLLTYHHSQRHLHSFPTRRSSDLLYDLSNTAEKIGLRSLNVRISKLSLKDVILPCILHWNKNHYIVLYKIKNENYLDRKSTRLNSSHVKISYAVFCLKKKTKNHNN